MFECFIAKVPVCGVAFNDREDGTACDANKVDGNVGCGD